MRERHKFDYEEIDIDTGEGGAFAERHSILSAPATMINDKAAFIGLPNRDEAIKIIEER